MHALASGGPLTAPGSGVQRAVLPSERPLASKAKGTVRLVWAISLCTVILGKGWGEVAQISLC